jgi:ATP-binding cassette, subfamily A (ABC1), member 3
LFIEQPITGNLIETVLNGMNATVLNNEFKEGGLGEEFYKELKEVGSLKYDELIKWAFTETRAMVILDLFESMFKQVEVLEHYYNSYLIKVSRDSYSIGYLFGMMEDNKAKYDISEYSVSQTTLEQIFNNFAKDAERNVRFK